MSRLRWLDLPFSYTTQQDFAAKLAHWLSQVFYDRLPAAGFEVREEQIYTAYHMAQALCQRQTLFAEAGSGTGKTFAYLLSSLCYARMHGKPVILSSASALLQQQLVGPAGDIATLNRILGLNIDARLAKNPSHHLCSLKAERHLALMRWQPGQAAQAQRLSRWMKTTRLGDRNEIPDVDDSLWQELAWDETLYCDRCRRRGYCQIAELRRHYHAAQDFVICSHDMFFAHLWQHKERMAEKQLPLLPDYAAVVFDEGHLIEQPALHHLGRPLRWQTVQDVLEAILLYRNHYRTALVLCLEGLEAAAQDFFSLLEENIVPHPDAIRWAVNISPPLLERGKNLQAWIEKTNDNITIETQLHRETSLEFDLNVYIKRLDALLEGLAILCQQQGNAVAWWEPATETLWVLPPHFSHLLGQELRAQKVPLLFTSATLQASGSFQALKNMVGIPEAKQTQVGTSFALAEQVAAYLPALGTEATAEVAFADKADHCLEIITAMQGKTLVLLNSATELHQWQQYMQQRQLPYPIYWEGSKDRGWLLEQFRRDMSSVLIGASFWEGVDIPGDALAMVVIFSLPYPGQDPLQQAKQRAALRAGQDPYTAVDMPAMVLKLRQGCGRLIRQADDRGILAILDQGPCQQDRQLIIDALPDGVTIYEDLEPALQHIVKP